MNRTSNVNISLSLIYCGEPNSPCVDSSACLYFTVSCNSLILHDLVFTQQQKQKLWPLPHHQVTISTKSQCACFQWWVRALWSLPLFLCSNQLLPSLLSSSFISLHLHPSLTVFAFRLSSPPPSPSLSVCV